ncbi:TadE/TadG family type IV pilus assembly protein [Mesobacterium pallidum]|uniref:TadE/TadG family type IV pilus assembly protein n=1 Tax=Mesobacterium pallidum TaxID=2872037 RepID=UPI001EE18CDC|nr:hypothetical protein [Mesobacterium pallidum]
MLTQLISRIRGFRGREEGSMTLEALIFIPLLISTLAATFAFQQMFHYRTLNTKAAYTITDALSRETEAIDAEYIDGMLELMSYLTHSAGPYSLRVSVVRYEAASTMTDEEGNEVIVPASLSVDWSKVRGDYAELNDSTVSSIAGRLPNMLDNERIIVVETGTDYVPPFPLQDLDLNRHFQNLVFTRPRFAPQLVYEEPEDGGSTS